MANWEKDDSDTWTLWDGDTYLATVGRSRPARHCYTSRSLFAQDRTKPWRWHYFIANGPSRDLKPRPVNLRDAKRRVELAVARTD